MVKFLLTICIAFYGCNKLSKNSSHTRSNIFADSSAMAKQQLLEDFEVLLLCHCQEYFTQRVFIGASRQFLDENKGQIFSPYVPSAHYNQYYSEKFKKSLLFRQPYSIVWGTNYNYSRIDSLYFNPMYKYYIDNFKVTAHYVNQIGDLNYFYDCYYRVKEIPLEKELDEFIRLNSIRD